MPCVPRPESTRPTRRNHYLESTNTVFAMPIEPFGFVVPGLFSVSKRGYGCDRVFTRDAGVLSFDIFNGEDKSSAPGEVQRYGQTLEGIGVHGQLY
jgi:hypothetical protein